MEFKHAFKPSKLLNATVASIIKPSKLLNATVTSIIHTDNRT